MPSLSHCKNWEVSNSRQIRETSQEFRHLITGDEPTGIFFSIWYPLAKLKISSRKQKERVSGETLEFWFDAWEGKLAYSEEVQKSPAFSLSLLCSPVPWSWSNSMAVPAAAVWGLEGAKTLKEGNLSLLGAAVILRAWVHTCCPLSFSLCLFSHCLVLGGDTVVEMPIRAG